MTRLRMLSGLSVAAILVIMLLPGSAVAQEAPCRFYGGVTVDGEYVSDGTTVIASIDGVVDHWTTDTFTFEGESVYRIDIPKDNAAPPDKDGGTDGDTVHFSVTWEGKELSAGSSQWQTGGFKELPLQASTGATPPPTYLALEANFWGNIVSAGEIIDTRGNVIQDGQLQSPDGKVTLAFHKGDRYRTKAGEGLRTIEVEPVSQPPSPPEDTYLIEGTVYDFGPDGATFSGPLDLTLKYDPSHMPEEIVEEYLTIAYYVPAGEWVMLGGAIDTEAQTVTVGVADFTVFAILGASSPPPATFTVNHLTISPKEVQLGHNVSITAEVSNTGGTEGSYDVVLKINDATEETKSVTLAPGASETVAFTITKNLAATYDVDVDGQAGQFTVTEGPPPTFTVGQLTISPREVELGHNVSITAEVSNTGGTEGSHDVVLKINDATEETKSVTLAPGASETVAFTVTKNLAATYNVAVDGQTGEFTVREAGPAPSGPNWPLIAGIIGAVVVIALVLVYFLVLRKRA